MNLNEINFEKEIRFENVSYKYSRESENILEKINVSFKKGQLIGVSGASGAGKTTFFDLLTGLIEPQSGQIYADDKNININYLSWHKKISYVEQSIFLMDSSIAENIAFGVEREFIDLDRIKHICNELGLTEYIQQLPSGLESFVGERGVMMSGGQMQRIGIARALYNNSEILIFDEITSSLDKDNEKLIMEIIKKLKVNKTIFLISHNEKLFQDCDIVLNIKNRKVDII